MATNQSEIANMIAEGGPAPQEAGTPASTESPAIRGLAAASMLLGRRVLKAAAGVELGNAQSPERPY
jgi:hypothetical protein